MNYRNHTIEPDHVGYRYYNNFEGIDCDWSGDGWRSFVKSASSIQDAKEQIDDKIFEATSYEVIMHKGTRDERSYPFLWLEDASKFCKLWGASLENKFDSI